LRRDIYGSLIDPEKMVNEAPCPRNSFLDKMVFVDEIINMTIEELLRRMPRKKGIANRERKGDADEIIVG